MLLTLNQLKQKEKCSNLKNFFPRKNPLTYNLVIHEDNPPSFIFLTLGMLYIFLETKRQL